MKGLLGKQKRKIAICMTLCICMLFSGCNFKTENKRKEVGKDTVFTYAGTEVSKAEVYIYTLTVKERYELQYGESIWEEKLPAYANTETDADNSMEAVTREAIINEIVRVKTYIAHSDDFGIEISEEEKQKLHDKAVEFYEGLNDADVNSMQITEDIIYQVLYENVVANEVKKGILEKNPIEISDEEARMTTFYDMYFPCYTKNENGDIVPYSDEDKEKQYANALQACSMLATAELDDNEDAQSIEKLAAYYNLVNSAEYTITPKEIEETYGADICEKLYAMKNGDYSTVIESEYGYHVFEMIALTDPKATSANKEIIYQDAVETLYSDTLIRWQSNLDEDFNYPESVNQSVYDSIP